MTENLSLISEAYCTFSYFIPTVHKLTGILLADMTIDEIRTDKLVKQVEKKK